MTTTVTADYIFPADRAPIRNGFISYNQEGMITEIGEDLPEGTKHTHYKGALVPGFINTHCHLELSHLVGKVDTGTGLLPFLKGVVSLREVEPNTIAAAIKKADLEMWASGIQAVGDISNTADTAAVKTHSKIRYFTFIESFDFLQGGDMAKNTFAKAKEVFELHPEPKRFVPHAPYTVSEELYALIKENNLPKGTVCIHNQETQAENDLFKDKSGGFLDFYDNFGFNIDHFKATNSGSLPATLKHLNPAQRILFVHNTLTTVEDIEAAEDWCEKVYWATCPNANLYIENKLPNYQLFIDEGVRMTIGTDSLTSNWQLSILEEMKTIQRYQSYVDTRTLVQWACLNGAEALGFDAQMGSLSPGKHPGIIWINHLDDQAKFTNKSQANRIL